MSDKETATADASPKKKGKLGKIIVMAVGGIVLIGGGVGAGLYAAGSGMIGGDHASAKDENKPKLVPKSEQKRGGEGAEGGEGGSGEGEGGGSDHAGKPTPEGEGGERYASNYYAMEKDFTANLQDSVHFIQVGLALSTPYDDKVIQNIKTNDIAIRSAVLMALGDTTEDQVFTSQGKAILAKRLVASINATLKQKEGFGGVSNVYFTNFVIQ
ncbi:flagellar basal body-associated FliL family protein [Sphingomonas radiodurans]|uniref:flagellar basal body-associated FliL family protein n=1 Tax=Sphingomonas radiodurans TaxID=2890321 RepID=UPI001E352B9E|nr:flagellar basal body-associated FliL family protein [Sphingomonas radiodurans]WBH15674.1 flagellar basal body-associated FliL family protein [Sphingomonas radiodurans]